MSPLGMWFMFVQLNYITNLEEIFIFSNKKVSYLYNVINLRVVRKILQKDSLKKIIMLYL